MKRKCINSRCNVIFGDSGDLTNGSVTGSLCDNCFINYLELRVKYLQTKPQTPAVIKSLTRNKKRLTLMLIKKQEGKRC